ncbi:hypothetical protein [Bradyrhizobium sp. LMG 9283]
MIKALLGHCNGDVTDVSKKYDALKEKRDVIRIFDGVIGVPPSSPRH